MSVPVAGVQALAPVIQRSEMVELRGYGTGLWGAPLWLSHHKIRRWNGAMPKANGSGNVVQRYPIKPIHSALICTTGIAQHQGLCPCHPALAAEGSGARDGRAVPHSQAEAVSGGSAVKGALRPCFRSPERWSCSDEPGARPLTGMLQGGRCGSVRCRNCAGRGFASP